MNAPLPFPRLRRHPAPGRLLIVALAGLALPAPAPAQMAGDGRVVIGQVTGGGGRSSGGGYSVAGSVAVPACAVSVGRGMILNGGLVGAYVIPTPGVTLELVRVAPTEGLLSWSAEAQAEGYLLEATSGLGPAAVWQPVTPAPAGTSLAVPLNQPARFYRLRKP